MIYDYDTFLQKWLEAETARHEDNPEAPSLLRVASAYAQAHGKTDEVLLCNATQALNSKQPKEARAYLDLVRDAGDTAPLKQHLLAKTQWPRSEVTANAYTTAISTYKNALDNCPKPDSISDVAVKTLYSWMFNNLGLAYQQQALLHLNFPAFFEDESLRAMAEVTEACRKGIDALQTAGEYCQHYFHSYNLSQCYFVQAKNALKKDGYEIKKEYTNAIEQAIKAMQAALTSLKASNLLRPKAVLARELGTLNLWKSSEDNARACWIQAAGLFREAEKEYPSARYQRIVVEDKLRLLSRNHTLFTGDSTATDAILELLKKDKCKDGLRLLWVAEHEDALLGPPTRREELYAMLSGINHDAFREYIDAGTSSTRSDVRTVSFLCARGWSSSIPLLLGSATRASAALGGGYLFTACLPRSITDSTRATEDKAVEKPPYYKIVVDPGHNFIANVHALGQTLADVTHVFVSHDHSDHAADLTNLDDLLYELWKRCNEEKGLEALADRLANTRWIPSKEVQRRLVNHYNSVATTWNTRARDLQGVLESSNFSWLKRQPDSKNYFGAASDDWKVHVEAVQHDDSIQTLASLWTFGKDDGKAVVLYTADMEWPGKPEEGGGPNTETAIKNLTGRSNGSPIAVDVMLGHVSQVGYEELLYNGWHKEMHLGLTGLVDCIQLVQPRYVLVGEFYGGLSDHRIRTCRVLVERLEEAMGENRPEVLPLDMGFECVFDLSSAPTTVSVRCSTCRELVAFEEISCVCPDGAFGRLQFLCIECLHGYRRSGEGDIVIGKRMQAEYRRGQWLRQRR